MTNTEAVVYVMLDQLGRLPSVEEAEFAGTIMSMFQIDPDAEWTEE